MTNTSQTWSPRSALRRLFLDRQAEYWMSQLDSTWSRREVRARVLEVIEETPDTRTFVLQPNRSWRGHLSGQYASIEVEIDGVRVSRCYSIASAPHPIGGPISITVKHVPGGRVSGWLHRNVGPGHVLRLSQAAGDFVLPQPRPQRVLMVSGGVGITPVMSMLRELAQREAIADVAFVHYARSAADVIFGEELQDVAERHAGLRLIVRTDDGGAPAFDEAELAALVPDYAERATYLCGPGAMMERVERLWHDAGASANLRRERFAPPAQLSTARTPGAAVGVRLARSDRRITAAGAGSLLEQLERAGERPASGCRIGICHTCTCRKQSGTVENLLTGEVSSEPNQDIQLCISVPRSDLDLDL